MQEVRNTLNGKNVSLATLATQMGALQPAIGVGPTEAAARDDLYKVVGRTLSEKDVVVEGYTGNFVAIYTQ